MIFHALKPTQRYGLTMLEMILATVIFAILGVIILGVFRTGTHAYEKVTRQAVLLDQAQVAFDSLERDIHSVFYRDEDEYNVNIEGFIRQLGLEGRSEEEIEDILRQIEDGGLRNPYEQGILIDLQCIGEPHGDNASLSFATYHPREPGRSGAEWGLYRVTYKSEGGALVRSEESVMDVSRNVFGEAIEKKKKRHTVLAEGVSSFQLYYGYWFDEVWIESRRWNSTRRDLRSSFSIMSPEEDEELLEALEDPNSLEYQQREQLYFQGPPDNLPSWVRITLTLEDPANPKYAETFHTVIRVHTSKETYVPNPQLDRERRDEEIRERLRNAEEEIWGARG